MQKYEVEGHEPSLLPEGRFSLVWADEFDGTELDDSKWGFRLNMMQQRWVSWTDSKEALHLDGNSNAVFTLVEEENRLCCAQLQTGSNYMDQPLEQTKFGNDHLQWPIGSFQKQRFLHRYGYYECRCRLQQKEGWWSAFWIQSPNIGSTETAEYSGSELDIMECFHPGHIISHNVFSGGYGRNVRRTTVGGTGNGEPLDKTIFHRFGILWTPKGYTFYVDGVEDGKVECDVSAVPEFILISTEVIGYRYRHHVPVRQAFDAVGDTFLVDYVRVFDLVED